MLHVSLRLLFTSHSRAGLDSSNLAAQSFKMRFLPLRLLGGLAAALLVAVATGARCNEARSVDKCS
jgi:hypothetical protein